MERPDSTNQTTPFGRKEVRNYEKLLL